MIKWSMCPFVIFLLLFFLSPPIKAQSKGGTVTYQAIKRYDFQTMFAPFARDYPDLVNSIPTESKGQVTLAFTAKNALFDTRADEQILPKQLRDAQAKAVYMQGPSTELKKVYLDLEKTRLSVRWNLWAAHLLFQTNLKQSPGS